MLNKFKAHLHKRMKILEAQCMNKINNFRAEVMAEAHVFIRRRMEATAKILTREHHAIIEQFIEYKRQIQEQIDLTEDFQDKFYTATTMVA